MTNQKVIPGIKPTTYYQVSYDYVVNDNKRNNSLIIQAETPEQAKQKARDRLKGKGPYKLTSVTVWSQEED